MSDVVRNVTIKLNIDAPQLKLMKPDTSGTKKAAKDIEQDFHATFTKIGKENSSVASQFAKKHKLPPPDISAVSQASTKIKTDFDSVFQRIGAQQASVTSQFAKTRQSAAGVLGDPMQLAGQAEAYKRVGEGIFTVARGIAFMNIQSEEELAAALKRIAYYQGMFDVFKGGTDIIGGLADSYRKLKDQANAARAATTAAGAASKTAADAAKAAAEAGAARGAGGAAGAGGAGLGAGAAAAGPVLLALAAIAAALGVGYVAWRKYGGAAEAEAERSKKAMEEQALAAQRLVVDLRSLDNAKKIGRKFEQDVELANQLGEFRQSLESDPRKRVAAIERQEQANRVRFLQTGLQQSNVKNTDEYIGQGLGLGVDAFDVRKGRKTLAPGFAEKMEADAANFEKIKNRLKAQSSGKFTDQATIDRAEKAADLAAANPNDKKKAQDAKQAQQEAMVILERQKALQESTSVFLRNQVTSARSYVSALQAQQAALQQNLDLENQRYLSIKQALRAEADSRKTAAQRFGELNDFEQQQLKDIAAKVKAGGVESLMPHERTLAKDSGFFDSPLAHFNLKRGLGAGFEKFSENAGTFEQGPTGLQPGQKEGESQRQFLERQAASTKANLAQGAGEMQNVTAKLDEGVKAAEKAIQEFDGFQRIAEKMNEMRANAIEAINNVGTKFNILNGRIDDIELDRRRGGIASWNLNP